MVYRDDLERIRKELLERKEDLLYEQKMLPDGELMIVDQAGLRKYYQRLPAKGNRKKERRYGIKKKPEVLKGLVRKDYTNIALKTIDQDIRALDLACKRYKPIDENTLMEGFVK